MSGDVRDTPLFQEIEEHYRRIHEPAFGRISGASDPAPSPDGQRLAFTGTRLEKLEGAPLRRICVVDTATREMEEVTTGPNDDRQPRWSPGGDRLSFLSDRRRRGSSQLFFLEAGRIGEARAGTEVDGSVEYHAWSPTGEFILMVVAEAGADLAGVEGSGTKDLSGDQPPEWAPSVERLPQEEGWRTLWVYDASSGAIRRVSRPGLTVWEATWCGSDRIAAVVSESPAEDAWYTASLSLIDVASADERILYTGKRQLGLPAASPSGRRIALVEALASDRMILAGDLLLLDTATSELHRVDTAAVDVTDLRWRDEDRLLISGLRGTKTVVAEYDGRTASVAELWSTSESAGDFGPVASPMGDRSFVLVVESYERYPEVAVVSDGTLDVMTSLEHEGAAYLRGVGGLLEEVTWKASDGLEIEGLIALPGGQGPHPLVTLVHGGPISAFTNRWAMGRSLTPLLVSRGYAVLHPNPRGSSGRGQAFAEMVYGDMGGADSDDILTGIDEIVRRGVADPARLGVMGVSYGGFMTAWLVTRTDRFAAAAALSPVTDWYSQHYTSNIGFWDSDFLQDDPAKPGGEYFERSPVMHARRVRTPTLVTAGARDKCTPAGQAVEFHRAIGEHGVESELAIYPEEGHGVRTMPALIDWHTRIVGWFERHMPAKAE